MTQTAKPKRTRRFARTPEAGTTGRDVSASAPDTGEAAKPAETSTVKAASKISRVLLLLQRPEGTNLDEMVAATGWLPHTTRAALTGLKKKGHTITSEKEDDVRRYRIAAQ
jgi:hypothetical protein